MVEVISAVFRSHRNSNIDASYRTIDYRGYTIAIEIRQKKDGDGFVKLKTITDNLAVIKSKSTWCENIEDSPELIDEWLPEAKRQIDERADRNEEIRDGIDEVVTGLFDQ